MTAGESRSRNDNLHLIITDSGLGGLSICAEVERKLRQAAKYEHVQITYFNAWPDERRGYNDLPDMAARARVFDRALERMVQFQPDHILIACNTLSIIYGLTNYRRTAAVPVMGIIEAGADLFYEALTSDPVSSIVLIGTRTTIESGTHRQSLMHMGIHPDRITSVPCPGLAAAIETDPAGPEVARLIGKGASDACAAGLTGRVLYCGFCCTHYTYVSDQIRSALERASGKTVCTLDPKDRLVSRLVAGAQEASGKISTGTTVEVISKVSLDENKRRAIAQRVESVSGITSSALLSYTHMPDLF